MWVLVLTYFFSLRVSFEAHFPPAKQEHVLLDHVSRVEDESQIQMTYADSSVNNGPNFGISSRSASSHAAGLQISTQIAAPTIITS